VSELRNETPLSDSTAKVENFECPWCDGTCNEPENLIDEPCQLCGGQGALRRCDGDCEPRRLVPADLYYCLRCLTARFGAAGP
jgi:hypothetical protein